MPTLNLGTASSSGQPVVLRRDVILAHPTEQLHFPFLCEAKDGTWYTTYREGPHGPLGGDRVQCALSRDRGKTTASGRNLGRSKWVASYEYATMSSCSNLTLSGPAICWSLAMVFLSTRFFLGLLYLT